MAGVHEVSENPFYVLGVAPSASPEEVELAARELATRIQQGEPGIDFYPTPLGFAARDEKRVRDAARLLRDPQRRLVHEFWARLPVVDDVDAPPCPVDGEERGPRIASFDALATFGWGHGGDP